MPKQPSLEELDFHPANEHKHDFQKASQVLKAMDFLRSEAEQTNIEEIVRIIDASFNLLLTSYYCILRYEMTKLSGTDFVQ